MPIAKLRAVWRNIYDSLWFLPAIFTITAIGTASVLLRADPLLPEGFDRREIAWLFSGGAEGARGVLAAIAGSIITVTGVVFSVTVVALQLASSQYTPRVLRTFMADRANHFVLGVFIGTFVYALLVMRSIHGGGDDYDAFVPAIATTAGVVFAVISIGCLIFYIHHVASSLQAETIMSNITRDTLRTISDEYPEGDRDEATPAQPTGNSHPVLAGDAGYVTGLEEEHLLDVARRTSCVVCIDVAVGDFVYPGSCLATLWGDRPHEDTMDKARQAFATDSVRTPHQDLRLGVIELVDMAIKALSPGVNDPTTAMSAIDRLGEIVLELGRRRRRTVREENGAVILLRIPAYDDIIGLAFDQISHYAAEHPAVIQRIAGTIGSVGSLLPQHRRGALRAQLARVRIIALEKLTLEFDRAAVGDALDAAERRLAEARG